MHHPLAEPSALEVCIAAKTLVLEFDDEPRKPPPLVRGQSPEAAARDRQLQEDLWKEAVDEAVEEGRLVRLDVAELVWPRVTCSKFTILTTCRQARSFLADHPILQQAGAELTVIELDQDYRWSDASPIDLDDW
ncbi:MAG: hypothetical protein IPK71_01595 [Myxococcales bacterium]|nr:hypothetical protein [Myxococcales bacterium]